jgi:hypothetical protein
VYELLPEQPLTVAFQEQTAQRMAELITCLHPILQTLRADYRRKRR